MVSAAVTTCPSCGAALGATVDADEPAIPGLTQVDAATSARRAVPRPNRLVTWLAGVDEPLPPPSPMPTAPRPDLAAGLAGTGEASWAPPSLEVRREMARLELEAIKAELEARAPEAVVDGQPPVEAEGSAGG